MPTKTKPERQTFSLPLEPLREVTLPGHDKPIKARTAVAFLGWDGEVAAVVFDVDREAACYFRAAPAPYATIRRLPLDDACEWAWNAAADGRVL